jgi:(2Fe-2S) ferredoxin
VSGPFAVHAFVCLGGKTCPVQGSDAIWAELKARVREKGLAERIRINKSGCLSQCGHGPMVCVYPQGVWYSGVQAADVDAILAHLEGGPVHEPRRYTPAGPGSNKIPLE